MDGGTYNEDPASQKIITLRHGGTQPQLDFWQSKKRFRSFVGGVGSGKTRAGVVELLRQPAGSRITVVAPTYRMLEDATIQTFREVGGSFFRPEEFKRSENKCMMLNGTEILFRSCDDPDKLRGPNLSAFWLDEAAMMPALVWDLMIGRLRLEPGVGWCTTTPRGKNWLYKLFVAEKREDYHLVQCSSRSNTFLPAYFIKALADKYSGHWLKQELEGEFVEFVEAAAYESFNSRVNVLDDDVQIEDLYDPRLPLHLSIDFNHALMAWQVIQVKYDEPVVITEISQAKKANIPAMVMKFRTLFPTHAAGLKIYGDASGHQGSASGRTLWSMVEDGFLGYLSEPEFYIPRKNPGVKERIHSVNQVLKGANKWQALKIHWSCKYLIEDFQRVQWRENGNDIVKIMDTTDDRYTLTHASDSLGYWVMIEMPSSLDVVSVEQVAKEWREERMQADRKVKNHGQGLAGI